MKTISKQQQEHYTKICKYCKGTTKDPFNKKERCPNCIKPYTEVESIDLTQEEKDELLMEEVNLGIQ